jgi:hypothetical protein
MVNLRTHNKTTPTINTISTAEVGSLTLEFYLLSHYTGDSKYMDLVNNAMYKLIS